jgi:3-oxoacyl-[acyl-carrier protein] reductase
VESGSLENEVAIVTGAAEGIGRAISAALAGDGAAVLLNDVGSYFLAQAAARRMVEQRSGGAIVLTSSIAAHVGYPGLAAYSMTKAALESLARSLAVELAPHAIRVNAVAPGHTLVPRNLADDPDYESRWASLTPSGRIATPVDIANAVVFLLSSRSEQIRGQTLVIDGGWSIRGSMSER